MATIESIGFKTNGLLRTIIDSNRIIILQSFNADMNPLRCTAIIPVVATKGIIVVANRNVLVITILKIDNTPYTYTTATVEGKNNFWILQFYCPSADLAANQPEIDIILQSIQPNL